MGLKENLPVIQILLGSNYYFDLWQLHKKSLSAIVPFVTNLPQEAIFPLYIFILEKASSDLKQLDVLNLWMLVTYGCWFSLMPCRADLGKWLTKDLKNAKILPEIKVKWGKYSVEEMEENPSKLQKLQKSSLVQEIHGVLKKPGRRTKPSCSAPADCEVFPLQPSKQNSDPGRLLLPSPTPIPIMCSLL